MKKIMAISTPTSEGRLIGITRSAPAHAGWFRSWQYWAPYAAVAWSLAYAALGLYWAVSGFSNPPGLASSVGGPLAGMLGPVGAWILVITAGFPAACMGILMLGNVGRPRLILISAGVLLAGALLLLMTSLILLIAMGYTPYIVFSLITGAGYGGRVLNEFAQSWGAIAHQQLSLVGGFLWLAATLSYARRSGNACLYCGRRDGPDGWTDPAYAARWGRIAVYVAMVAPVIYAAIRYAWALGIPLGMSIEDWRIGQERGTWSGGLFLATFGLVGGVLMLGLVQHWGEVFPRWMVGLSGRRVPIALAVVPAAIVSVLLIVGGIAILSGYIQVSDEVAASGQNMAIVVGPTFLFPMWGAALAVAALGYYYRRRGPCRVCGRGTHGDASKPSASYSSTGQTL